MKQLDEQLDKKPTTQAVIDMAELRIRNLLAFEELQSFNDTGKFRYKHPFIAHPVSYTHLTLPTKLEVVL